MPATVLTSEDLHDFKIEFFDELKKFLTPALAKEQKQEEVKWLKSHQVQRMFGISPGTLQNLRINGTIPFTKIGGVIVYSLEDINTILQRNKRNDLSNGKK